MLKSILPKRFVQTILLILCISLFSSCVKTDPKTTETSSSGILTDIYTSIEFPVPEDYWMIYSVTPYYDESTGNVTVFSLKRSEVETEQEITQETTGWLHTFNQEGKTLYTEQIPLPENVTYVYGGAVTEKALIYVSSSVDKTVVYRYDRDTGETISTDENIRLFEDGTVFKTLVADPDGLIYCTDAESVVVLNSDLSYAFSYDFSTAIYTMAGGADGAVWVTFNAGMESCAAKIDTEKQTLGEYHTFTRGSDTLSNVRHSLLNAASVSEKYNFYYYDKQDTVWGVAITEDGSLAEERLIDLYNSGISELYGYNEAGSIMAGLYVSAILSEEHLLTTQYDGQQYSVPVLYSKSQDIDTSTTETITIAYTYALDPTVVKQITTFDSEHPEILIVMEDYSKYATEEDRLAGEDKLCFDLLNGLIEPDIVVTSAGHTEVSDNMVMTQLTRNNLYVDLVPYLEKDNMLNFDTLFGCIPRLFDDGNGGMWGVSTNFSLMTLVGKKELLGGYAENGYWTLGEMLDFFDTLPEDAEKIYKLYSKSPDWSLLCQGYELFLNDNGCTFTSDSFIRFLELLKTLPASYIDWKRTSPYADINTLDYEMVFGAVSAEKIGMEMIMLGSSGFLDPGYLKVIISDEFYPIGYATKTDSGSRVYADHAYVITTFSEVPDVCFELIKSFFETDIYGDTQYFNSWRLPSLKPQFDEAIHTLTEDVFEPLTEKEFAKTHELFDQAGNPIIQQTPSAINAIIDEEISSYLSGMGTAEECADKIQSRVEIWIAEHE